MSALLAEVIGSALFQFLGGSSTALQHQSLVVSALGNGLAFAACVYLTADLSGGHINPAITTALLLTKRLENGWRQWILYVLAQLFGGLIGSCLLWVLLPVAIVEHHSYAVLPTHDFTGRQIILCFVLMLTFMCVRQDPATYGVAPLAVGLSVSAGIFAFGPLTGCCLNPLRIVGPGIVMGTWHFFQYYIAGSLLGMIVAVFFFDYFFNQNKETAQRKSSEYV